MKLSESRPLTRSEKTAAIHVFMESSSHKDELFLPDEVIYAEHQDQLSITDTTKKICVWLGIKPHNLLITTNSHEKNGYQKSIRGHHINIAPRVLSDPFLVAALLAKACLEYYFVRKKQEADIEYLELASIECGLGLLFINNTDAKSLDYFSYDQYVPLFVDYVNRNRLDPRVVLEHTLIPAMRHLPKSFMTQPIGANEPFVARDHHSRQVKIYKIIGVVLAGIMVISLGLFMWLNQPKRLSPELQAQKESIEILLSAHALCAESAQDYEKTSDDDDVFAYRQLDAKLTRCKSIRNRHDFIVKDYNAKLAQGGY